MRYDFFDIFEVHDDGSVSSEFPVRVHGVTLKPGTKFKPGMFPQELDIASMIGHDVKATIHEINIFVIDKFF